MEELIHLETVSHCADRVAPALITAQIRARRAITEGNRVQATAVGEKLHPSPGGIPPQSGSFTPRSLWVNPNTANSQTAGR